MLLRKFVAVLALVAGCGGVGAWSATTWGQAAASQPAKLKTELKFETMEDAMRSYLEAWKNMEFGAISACITISDPTKKKTAEMYINYHMWRVALERACIAKYGAEDGMGVLGHVRTLDNQFDVDIKRVLQTPNIDVDLKDRSIAHMFLRREKDRPEGLEASDDMNFRDDYWLVKKDGAWKVDFLKTYNMSDMDEDRANLVRFNVDTAFPKIAKKLKELTDQVKKGEIKTADEVKDKLSNEWSKIDVPEMPGGKDVKDDAPAEK